MNTPIRRILLLYADTYYLVNQVYPFGLDVLAHHLRRRGYTVVVGYPFLEHRDPETNLKEIIDGSRPDLIGIGIRNLDTAFSLEPFGDYDGADFRTFFFLPHVQEIVGIIRNLLPQVPLILGGGAFSIAPVSIMKQLGIEFGIIGEGESAFAQFLEVFPNKERMTGIANLAFEIHGNYHVSARRPSRFADQGEIFKREETFNYAFETSGIPIRTKRGCNRTCSYCVEPLIEGRRFFFKNQEAVIQELKFISDTYDHVRNIFIADAEFNIPDLSHGRTLVRNIIAAGLHERFRFSSQFLPKPFDEEFAELLSRAGFSVVLTCDSFSDEVLEKNLAPFRKADIENTLALCSKFSLDCTICLIFGLPGETHNTVEYTLQKMRQYPMEGLRHYEYTMGGRIYSGTYLSRLAEKTGRHLYGEASEGYLKPLYYCSPQSPLKLKTYVEDRLPFAMAYKPVANDMSRQILGTAYLADQKRWDAAAGMFCEIDLAAKSAIYDYLFRKLSDSGRNTPAKIISNHFLNHILESGQQEQYREQILLIQFYSSLLS